MTYVKRVNIELTAAEIKTASMRLEGRHGCMLLATGHGEGSRLYLAADGVAQYMLTGIFNHARRHPGSNPLKDWLEEAFKLEYWLNPTNRQYKNILPGGGSGMIAQSWTPILRDINGFIFWLSGMKGRVMTPNDRQLTTLGPEYLTPGDSLTANQLTLQKVVLSYHHMSELHSQLQGVSDGTISFTDMLEGKQLPKVTGRLANEFEGRLRWGRTPEETGALSNVERQIEFQDTQGRIFSTTQYLNHDADITKVDLNPDDEIRFVSMGVQF